MKLRVLAFALAILAFFIFVGSPFQQTVEAVAIADDVLIAIIIAALAAMGITFAITGGYETAEEWVSDMIIDSGVSFSGVKYGASSSGSILLNNRFVKAIATLAEYIKNRYSLSNNAQTTIIQPTINAGSLVGITLPYFSRLDSGRTRNFYFVTGSSTVYGFAVNDSTQVNCNLMFYSTQPFTVTRYAYADGETMDQGIVTNTNGTQRNGYYITTAMGSARRVDVPYVYDSWNQVVTILDQGNIGVSSDGGITANTSVIDIPSQTDIGDKGGILTIPVPWGISIWDILTKIPGLVLDDELAGETTLDLDEESAVQEQIDIEATQASVSNNPGDYQIPGLQTVFPFCIPFDLYNFVSCLAADPVAPSFTWRFYVPGICDETLEIDLSEFNAAAQILRTMELLLFCVGLAFVTRKIIRG